MELLLGDDEQLAQKIQLGMEVIAREDTGNPEKKGSINLTIPKKAFFSEAIEPVQTTQSTTQAAA